ncbi:MAG: hypothetical protein AAGH15_28240, partial [Myxococcota bacterium]
MTSPRHDKLQKLFDGELTEGEAAELRAAALASAEDRAQLERFARLGDLVRLEAGGREDDVAGEADALFGRIQAELRATPQPRLHLIEEGRRNRSGATAFVALAIAAAVALAFFLRAESETVATPTEPPAPVEPLEHVVDTPQGTEVVSVDFGQHTGTYFEVPGYHGQPLAVVWI